MYREMPSSIEVQFNLPPGSRPEEVRYHSFGRSDYRPSETFFQDDRVVYIWRWLGRPASVPYAAGASFRRDLVASVYSPPRPSLFKSLFGRPIRFHRLRFHPDPLMDHRFDHFHRRAQQPQAHETIPAAAHRHRVGRDQARPDPSRSGPAAGTAAEPGAAAYYFRIAEKRKTCHQGDRGQGFPVS